jgi:Transglutaminase-like superfamily
LGALERMREMWYFSRAYATLFRARHLLDRDGFERARHALIKPWKAGSQVVAPDDPRLAAVDTAIDSAVRWHWKLMDCLPRALTAYVLLRSMCAQPMLHIGVRTKPFGAHAWTTVSGRVVADGNREASWGDYVVLETAPAGSVPAPHPCCPTRPPMPEANAGAHELDIRGGEQPRLVSSTRLTVSGHIRFVEAAGEVVVLDRRKDAIFGVEGPGAVALIGIGRGDTFGEIVDRALTLYDVERPVLEADLAVMVGDFCRRGWCSR